MLWKTEEKFSTLIKQVKIVEYYVGTRTQTQNVGQKSIEIERIKNLELILTNLVFEKANPENTILDHRFEKAITIKELPIRTLIEEFKRFVVDRFVFETREKHFQTELSAFLAHEVPDASNKIPDVFVQQLLHKKNFVDQDIEVGNQASNSGQI